MLEYRQFCTGHLKYLTPQRLQKYDHAILFNDNEYANIIEQNFALSVWDKENCIAAGGVIPIFSHRAVAWAILSNDAAPYMLSIVRKVRQVICALPYQRIEIAVRADFEDGQRFARLLGMKLETPEPMQAHGATGDDEHMYAVVKQR